MKPHVSLTSKGKPLILKEIDITSWKRLFYLIFEVLNIDKTVRHFGYLEKLYLIKEIQRLKGIYCTFT